jgi:quercetin dioxygenase-like cupin family protein
MSRTETRELTRETLGTGVHRPDAYQQFTPEAAHAARMYKDQDISLVVWNLEPGQENRQHSHPESAHTFLVLTGEGVYLRDDADPTPIRAGDYIIIPRQVLHGIRNTGTERLSYVAFTSQGPNGYSRNA